MPATPAPPRRCPTCGASNQAFATFCHDCGEPLSQAAPLNGAGTAALAVPPRARRWEIGAALVLIVGVLGFALADWGQREQQAQLYRSGVAAATAHHWDTAANAFAALGTYRDSVKRRQETAQAILLRDTSYIAGNEAVAWKDWITAYHALSQTVAIEAGYRNAQALFDTATREAPRQALADTIIRRTDGARPGLYVRRADGSEGRLEGSDADSVVWATDPKRGRVVYDSPDFLAQPAFPPNDDSVVAIRRLPSGRHLLVADTQPAAQPPARLPDLFGSGGYLLLGPQGVWSLNLSEGNPKNYSQPILAVALDSISYADVQTGAVITNVLTEAGTYLLDLNAVQQQVLLGQYDPLGVNQPHTQVYMLAGGSLQRVDDISGFVQEAELSQDGHTALYSVGGPPVPTNHRDAWLLWDDLTRPDLPDTVVLSQTYVLAPSEGQWLRGRIVSGPTPRVLIRDGLDPQGPIRLGDVQSGEEQILWQAQGRAAINKYWVAPDGETLFLVERPEDDSANTTLVIQPLNPVRPPTRIPMPRTQGTDRLFLLDAQLLAGRLVCRFAHITEVSDNAPAQSFVERLYSLSPTDPRATPVLLGEQPVEINDIVQSMAPQLPLLSDKLLGSRVPDGFRLRTLDGLAILPPLPGVSAIWTFQPAPSLLFWSR